MDCQSRRKCLIKRLFSFIVKIPRKVEEKKSPFKTAETFFLADDEGMVDFLDLYFNGFWHWHYLTDFMKPVKQIQLNNFVIYDPPEICIPFNSFIQSVFAGETDYITPQPNQPS